MATISSIHIKPCNITSSGAHNRRTVEYMRNIGESKIYVVSELSGDNEQWINPDFGSPDLQTHYDHIKQMVKEKTGRAMQEKDIPSVHSLQLCLTRFHPLVLSGTLFDAIPVKCGH